MIREPPSSSRVHIQLTVDCWQYRRYSDAVDGIPEKLRINKGRVTARLQSTEQLRKLILGGILSAGERLNEVELSAQFGMSRGPIRESLQTLAAEGLVTILSHKGTFVKQFTTEELANLYEVRLVLETYACRQAAVRRSPTEIESLSNLLDVTREHLTAEGTYPNEHDFHMQVLAMTHNEVLMNQGKRLLAQMVS